MRIVVDTNVFVSAVLKLNSLPALHVEKARAVQHTRYFFFILPFLLRYCDLQ